MHTIYGYPPSGLFLLFAHLGLGHRDLQCRHDYSVFVVAVGEADSLCRHLPDNYGLLRALLPHSWPTWPQCVYPLIHTNWYTSRGGACKPSHDSFSSRPLLLLSKVKTFDTVSSVVGATFWPTPCILPPSCGYCCIDTALGLLTASLLYVPF